MEEWNRETERRTAVDTMSVFIKDWMGCMLLWRADTLFGSCGDLQEEQIQYQTDAYTHILLNWPAPPTIHRGLEWPQFLNCSLLVCLFSVGKFSNFFVQYKAAGVRKNVVRMNTDVLI